MENANHLLTRTVNAELKVPAATIRLMRYDIKQPATDIFFCQDEDSYYLDLAVTPRPRSTRFCFEGRWAPHHYESPGRFFLVPPGEVLKARSDSGPQVSVVCLLGKQVFQQWFTKEFAWTDRCLEASLNVPSESIEQLLLRLGDEVRHPGFASTAICEAIIMQITIELSRHYRAIDELPVSGGLATWRLRLIDERLTEVRSPPTLTELADLCRLSVRQLTRSFRVSQGRSIGDYIADKRIENAKHLLWTNESVKSIAHSMGFGSPSSFCYAFRGATGRTPRQYRMKVVSAADSARS